MLPSYTILCHSTTPCSFKVVVVIVGGAEVGFEDVLVMVGGKTVEIDVVELLQSFILNSDAALPKVPSYPTSRVRVWQGYRFSYPYLYPCLPVVVTRAGFHTCVDHYGRLRLHKTIGQA